MATSSDHHFGRLVVLKVVCKLIHCFLPLYLLVRPIDESLVLLPHGLDSVSHSSRNCLVSLFKPYFLLLHSLYHLRLRLLQLHHSHILNPLGLILDTAQGLGDELIDFLAFTLLDKTLILLDPPTLNLLLFFQFHSFRH
jgi:hypothetical protein